MIEVKVRNNFLNLRVEIIVEILFYFNRTEKRIPLIMYNYV